MHEYSGAVHIHSVYSDGTGKIEDIAKAKMEDLNANDIDAAMNIVRGTARSMGIKTE